MAIARRFTATSSFESSIMSLISDKCRWMCSCGTFTSTCFAVMPDRSTSVTSSETSGKFSFPSSFVSRSRSIPRPISAPRIIFPLAPAKQSKYNVRIEIRSLAFLLDKVKSWVFGFWVFHCFSVSNRFRCFMLFHGVSWCFMLFHGVSSAS